MFKKEERTILTHRSKGEKIVYAIVFAIFVALAVTFLTGHGSSLIAGYNTASKEEKAKYDEKKLCRTFGVGMVVIAITILVTALLEDQLPMEAAYVIAGIIFVDAIVMIILGNTVCRRR